MDKLHEIIEKLEDCMYSQLSHGIENIDTDEMYKVADIYKDLVEAEYHCTITKAMKENADEYGETWDENGRKPYTRMRDSKGRYMNYQEPMMYDERMEGFKNGKMHYTEPMNNSSESMHDRNKRMYTETKHMNPADKTERLNKFNKYLDTIDDEITDLKDDFTPEERTTARQRFVNMSNKL